MKYYSYCKTTNALNILYLLCYRGCNIIIFTLLLYIYIYIKLLYYFFLILL